MSEITYNADSGRYEQAFDGPLVYANTHKKDGVLFIDYVHADPALRGKGAAGQFMAGLMARARAEKMKVTPICGYAAGWLRRHSEYDDLKAN
jgi:predicted GNAT family acetyltransferase